MKLCDTLFALPEWVSHWAMPPDQAYVNYVVLYGKLTDINFTVLPSDGFMTTVGYCNRKKNLSTDSSGNVGCPGASTIPSLIHQYIRIKKMREHFTNVCAYPDPEAFKKAAHSKESF